MTFRKTIFAAVTSTAMVFTGFAPAMAAPVGPANTVSTPLDMAMLAWNAENEKAGRYRGYRGYRHRRGRIDGGDVVAGILILGGIAAIAGAASNSRRDRRDDDRGYRDRDYRSNNDGYDNRRDSERRSQVGTNAMERAISACSDAAERQAGSDARTSEITAVAKDGNGWRVEGELSGASESNFLCGATNDQVDYVQLGDRDLAFAN